MKCFTIDEIKEAGAVCEISSIDVNYLCERLEEMYEGFDMGTFGEVYLEEGLCYDVVPHEKTLAERRERCLWHSL